MDSWRCAVFNDMGSAAPLAVLGKLRYVKGISRASRPLEPFFFISPSWADMGGDRGSGQKCWKTSRSDPVSMRFNQRTPCYTVCLAVSRRTRMAATHMRAIAVSVGDPDMGGTV